MTGQVPTISQAPENKDPQCNACGRRVAQPIDGRCSWCGERLHDADVTSDDHMPYAEALAAGQPGWRGMCGWVYSANRQRLRHLGLSRTSRASRRFARINLWLFAMTLALAVFANSGWRRVTPQPGVLAESPVPVGKGWWRITATPQTADALWWNPPWAVVAGITALIVTVVVGSILLALVGSGAARAARSHVDEVPRLRCAIRYSTAWVHLLALAAIAMVFAPLVQISAGLHWGKIPGALFRVPAALLAVTGLLLWWLWCIRLGQTLPKVTRARVQRFFVIWTLLVVLPIAAGTVYGSWHGADYLARALNLQW